MSDVLLGKYPIIVRTVEDEDRVYCELRDWVVYPPEYAEDHEATCNGNHYDCAVATRVLTKRIPRERTEDNQHRDDPQGHGGPEGGGG